MKWVLFKIWQWCIKFELCILWNVPQIEKIILKSDIVFSIYYPYGELQATKLKNKEKLFYGTLYTLTITYFTLCRKFRKNTEMYWTLIHFVPKVLYKTEFKNSLPDFTKDKHCLLAVCVLTKFPESGGNNTRKTNSVFIVSIDHAQIHEWILNNVCTNLYINKYFRHH